MKAMCRITSIIMLSCFSTLAENNIDAGLSNTVCRISHHFEMIRNEARDYLESGAVPTNINEEASVIIRKICLDRLERKGGGKSVFFLSFMKTNPEQERDQEIKRALEINDSKKLTEFATELITARRNKLVDEAIRLMQKVANGDTTSVGKSFTLKVINGVSEKTEVTIIAEVKKLQSLREEYQKLTVYLQKISAETLNPPRKTPVETDRG